MKNIPSFLATKRRQFLRSVGGCLLGTILIFSTQTTSAGEKLENTVLLMRHALAPGFGDPDHFVIGDCSTQRNLDEKGREQATQIGQRLKRMGILPKGIYSSQWCRCLETAERLALGRVQTHPGLNSFFQGIVDRRQTLRYFRELTESLESGKGPYLFVTHQVVITAITDIFPASGEIIAHDFTTGKSSRFPLNPNP